MTSTSSSDAAGWISIAARVLLAALFIWAGYTKIGAFDTMVGRVGGKGVPLPQLAIVSAILVEIGGGAMLIAGFKARWAAVALVVFCLLTAFMFHAFWTYPADQAYGQQVHFMKNLALAGSLLLIFVRGPGAKSIDPA